MSMTKLLDDLSCFISGAFMALMLVMMTPLMLLLGALASLPHYVCGIHRDTDESRPGPRGEWWLYLAVALASGGATLIWPGVWGA